MSYSDGLNLLNIRNMSWIADYEIVIVAASFIALLSLISYAIYRARLNAKEKLVKEEPGSSA